MGMAYTCQPKQCHKYGCALCAQSRLMTLWGWCIHIGVGSRVARFDFVGHLPGASVRGASNGTVSTLFLYMIVIGYLIL